MKVKNTKHSSPDVLFLRHVIKYSYKYLPLARIVYESEKYQELWSNFR